MSVKQLRKICEQTEALGAVIIDYVQLLSEDDADLVEKHTRSFYAVSADICAELKRMAKELDVPVICFSQLSRNCELRADKRPKLSDLRNPGLTAAADQILLLYRDRYYDPASPLGELAECIVAKNRHGDTAAVKLRWDPERLSFSAWEDAN